MVFNSDKIDKDLLDLKKRLIPRILNDLCDLYIEYAMKKSPGRDINEIRSWCSSVISKDLDFANEVLVDAPDEEFREYFIGMFDVFRKSLVWSLDKEVLTDFTKRSSEVIGSIDDLLSVYNIINISPEYRLEQNIVIFDTIDKFTSSLEMLDIPKEDHASIILELIRRNIDIGILEKSSKDYKFAIPFIVRKNRLTNKELKDIRKGKYDYLRTSTNKKLSDLENRIRDFFRESSSTDKGISYIDKFLDNHRVIKEHYFDKMDEKGNLSDFSTDDVNKVTLALEELGVSKKIKSTTGRVLMKEVSIKSDAVSIPTGVKPVKFGISEDEYKQLKKNVEKLFNIRSAKPIRPLSVDEVYYCAGTMLKMGEKKTIIEALFDRGLEKETDPIKRYNDEHDKWVYYGKKFERQDQVSEMDEIYQEAIMCSDEDKEVWSEMLGDYLKEFESRISKSKSRYEYEFKKAIEYTKKRG